MSKFLDSTGLGHLIEKIKATFVSQADTQTVQALDIDSTPTANSTNLVTSGGVKSYVDGAIPTDAVKYTQQSLTTAQKLQARQNIDADAFVVEILVSLSGLSTSVTYQEVVAAINAHKDIYINTLSVYMSVNSATFGSESAVLEAYGIAEGSVSDLDGFILTVRVFSNGDPAEVTSTNQSLGTYSKPSGGIPASDLASGVIPTVPTISTNISTDASSDTKTASPKAVYDEVHPTILTTQTAGGMLPNVMYNLGTLTGTVTFSLASPTDNTIVNHYYWTFTAGSTAPTITWPSGISWFGGSAPVITAGKHYDVSVLDNIAVCMEV